MLKIRKHAAWIATTEELTKWQKIQGVFMHEGKKCQVILMDGDDPIGVILQRPFRLIKENREILGSFKLKEKWLVAPYVKFASAFVCELEPDELDLVFGNPEVCYVEGKDRETLKIFLSERGIKHGCEKAAVG